MKHFWETVEPGWFNFANLYEAVVRWAPRQARFVEVGCFIGRSTAHLAVEIVNSGKEIDLSVVDTFRGNPGYQFMVDFAARHGGSCRGLFEENMRRGGVLDMMTVIEDFSAEAAKRFEDESLDFVFIDARHDFDSVVEDITAWWPKVRTGGILAGHDFYDVPGAEDACMVESAVKACLEATYPMTPTRENALRQIFGQGVEGRRFGACWVEIKEQGTQ